MKKLLKVTSAFIAGLAMAAGLAYATTNPNAFYAGYNQFTNQNGLNGVVVSGGAAPTSGGSTSCGTLGAITGGSTAGQVATAGVTTCTVQLVFPVSALVVSGAPGANGTANGYPNQTASSAPPNGAVCLFIDETHPATYAGTFAFVTTGTIYTGFTCTSASLTISSGDTLKYVVIGY